MNPKYDLSLFEPSDFDVKQGYVSLGSYEFLLSHYKDLIQERNDLLDYIASLKKSCGGRKSIITKDMKNEIISLANQGLTQSNIAKKLSISQASVSNVLKNCKVYRG